MRNINFKTQMGDISLQVSQQMVERVATRHSIPPDSVSDLMILRFFQQATDVAFQKAATEYIESDGKDT